MIQTFKSIKYYHTSRTFYHPGNEWNQLSPKKNFAPHVCFTYLWLFSMDYFVVYIIQFWDNWILGFSSVNIKKCYLPESKNIQAARPLNLPSHLPITELWNKIKQLSTSSLKPFCTFPYTVLLHFWNKESFRKGRYEGWGHMTSSRNCPCSSPFRGALLFCFGFCCCCCCLFVVVLGGFCCSVVFAQVHFLFHKLQQPVMLTLE